MSILSVLPHLLFPAGHMSLVLLGVSWDFFLAAVACLGEGGWGSGPLKHLETILIVTDAV